VLWANGFAAGRTFRLDLRDPARPRLAGTFESAGPYTHPHSFARLPNGNLLAAFQRRLGADGVTTGGLVELDTAGRVLRAVSAATAVDSTVRPYSLVFVSGARPRRHHGHQYAPRVDSTFRASGSERPGVNFGRDEWPHGACRASRRGVRSSVSREGYAGSL
jgi:hypothetical protein